MFSRHCQGAGEQNKVTALPDRRFESLKKRLRGCLAIALCPSMRKKATEKQMFICFWGGGVKKSEGRRLLQILWWLPINLMMRIKAC